MSDLIERQDVIDALELSLENDYVVAAEILAYVEQLPSAEPERKWIPVSERLPEDEEIYLVRVILRNGRVNWNRAWYDGMTWHGSGMVPEVTHWMKINLEVEE